MYTASGVFHEFGSVPCVTNAATVIEYCETDHTNAMCILMHLNFVQIELECNERKRNRTKAHLIRASTLEFSIVFIFFCFSYYGGNCHGDTKCQEILWMEFTRKGE